MKSIKKLFFISLILFIPLSAAKKPKREYKQEPSEFAPLYHLNEGENFKDITKRLLNSSTTLKKNKDVIKQSGRRYILFNYPSGDIKVRGYISYIPRHKNAPMIIFLRGGRDMNGLMNPASDLSCYGNYVTMGTAYRGSIYQGKDEFGEADLEDVKGLFDHIPVIEKHLGIKFKRPKTYMIGGSRGGMQLILALAKYPELQNKVDKIVSLSGLLDMKSWAKNASSYYTSKKDPMVHVEKIRSDLPFLIIQGTNDNIIPLSQGKAMVAKLKKLGHKVTYHEEKDAEHCLNNSKNRMKLITDWLKK